MPKAIINAGVEPVASSELSSNSLVDIESMTEQEMETVQKYYRKLGELAKKGESIHSSHSLDEANNKHAIKSQKLKKNDIKTIPVSKKVTK